MQIYPKEVLYFSLVFVLIALTCLCTNTIKDAAQRKLLLFPFSLLVAIVLAIVYYTTKVYESACNKSSDSFHFEVTKAKQCQGGPYMHQSGETHEMCKEFMSTQEGQDQYCMYNCGLHGFNGRPVHFEYTPLSDSNWNNTTCEKPILGNNGSPYVL